LYTPSPAVRAGVCRGPGLGDGGESLLAMRDTEISRLRRSYARSEVSRREMKRCLDALAVQLRDSEARTGALLADREAVRLELSAKEAELDRQKAFTEGIRAKALVEARSKSYLHPPASQVSARKAPPRHSVGASPAPLSRAGTRIGLASTPGRPLLKGMEGELNG
ncbi:unnamed protein product, partial [Ascophyllum nodosum]